MALNKSPADYVNPFIGTAARGNDLPEQIDFDTLRRYKPGNTFPGAVMPWGMVAMSPHTTFARNYIGSQSGYYFGEPHIYGFSPNHLSGVGCPALGNCLVMPTTGKVHIDEQRRSEYKGEVATAGYYKTQLTTHEIQAEMTVTQRAAVLRMTFPERNGDANLLIDAAHRLSWCDTTFGEITIKSATEFEGQSIFGHFCHNFMAFYGQPSGCEPEASKPVYFVGRFSKPSEKALSWNKESLFNTSKQSGSDVGGVFRFSTSEGERVYLKIGLSYSSIENAWKNLDAEIPDWDFDNIHQRAFDAWHNVLSVVEVKGGTEEAKEIFYTGLYHMLIHPSVYNDVNGEYKAVNGTKLLNAHDHTRYSVFSLWDTYRNVHPLLTLLYPDRQLDMVKSIIAMNDEMGRLPKWELCGLETQVMAGDPVVPIIVDTYLKGLTDFDVEKAYSALIHAATHHKNDQQQTSRPALKAYTEYGYIPHDLHGGSVSVTIDYSYADWCIAQLANALGKQDDYGFFMHRSRSYRNLFDPETGLFRPKLSDGSWLTPFDSHSLDGFVENNAWQYAFTAHHDEQGYAELLGGDNEYISRLQYCFDSGLYDMTNEPDLAYAFLFNYFEGESWRSQKVINTHMKVDFGVDADGLCGNDDCGAISGWYVFAAMGLYPLRQGDSLYGLYSPIFDEITIHLDTQFYSGKTFTVKTLNRAKDNIYIQNITLNGEPYTKRFLDHQSIINGGEIVLHLGRNVRNSRKSA